MRRLEINEMVIRLADDYRKEMNKLNFSALEKFKNDIDNGRFQCTSKTEAVQYVEKILSNIGWLQDAQPANYEKIIGEFNEIIPTERLVEIRLTYKYRKKTITKSFYEWIVDKMHYTDVRSNIFPKYIRQLGIKTCVYCNSQYAITTKKGIATYELDHCWPKSKYPYLSTNFFNLQPCCGICNRNKGNENLNNEYYSLSIWKQPEGEARLFGYRVDDSSLVEYKLGHRQESLQITYDRTEGGGKYEEFLNEFERKMKIEKIYEEYRDVAEEVIWKYTIYNPSYIQSLRKAFSEVFGNGEDDWFRFFYGTYMNTNESYKRPLSELIQDIAQQIGMPE